MKMSIVHLIDIAMKINSQGCNMKSSPPEFDIITIIQNYVTLLEMQEDLDVDFKQILIDNLWDLYEEEKNGNNL